MPNSQDNHSPTLVITVMFGIKRPGDASPAGIPNHKRPKRLNQMNRKKFKSYMRAAKHRVQLDKSHVFQRFLEPHWFVHGGRAQRVDESPLHCYRLGDTMTLCRVCCYFIQMIAHMVQMWTPSHGQRYNHGDELQCATYKACMILETEFVGQAVEDWWSTYTTSWTRVQKENESLEEYSKRVKDDVKKKKEVTQQYQASTIVFNYFLPMYNDDFEENRKITLTQHQQQETKLWKVHPVLGIV